MKIFNEDVIVLTHRAFLCGVPVRVGFDPEDENVPNIIAYTGFEWLLYLVFIFIDLMNYEHIKLRLFKELPYYMVYKDSDLGKTKL